MSPVVRMVLQDLLVGTLFTFALAIAGAGLVRKVSVNAGLALLYGSVGTLGVGAFVLVLMAKAGAS